MRRTVGILLLASAGAGLAPPSAAGQQITSPYEYVETAQEAGAFFGVIDPATGRFELGPGPGTVLGLRYAVEVGGPFSLEGVVRGVSSTRDVRDPTKAEGQRKVGEADVLLTSIEGRAKFTLTGRRTWHGLSPFVVAGGGIAWDVAGLAEVDQRILPEDRFEYGVSFLGHVGLGARWILFDHVQLRADGAFDLWQIDTPQGYLTPGRGIGIETAPPQSEWVGALEGTLGIAVRW